jgi:hypothetical protein
LGIINMTMRLLVQSAFIASVVGLAGCVAANTVRTSADTAVVHASAAPVCGGIGSANAAQKQAAIETLRDGFDRYIIMGGAAANNVHAAQMPGSYNTSGYVTGTYFGATTTYRPGPTVVYGSHDQSLAIKMFHDGEPGSEQAIPAREVLGPKWQKIVAGGVHSCM